MGAYEQLHEKSPIDAVSLEQYHTVLLRLVYWRELAVGPRLMDQAGVVSLGFQAPR
jgi:hypothetical protein